MAAEATQRERRAAAVAHSRFQEWLQNHGVDTSPLELRPSASGLSWAAHAAVPLAAGATVVSIPLSLALTEDVVLSSGVAKDATRLGLSPTTRTVFYVFMLLERAAADDGGGWGPYLRAIPARHADPQGWSRAELQLLRGTGLLEAVRRRRRELRAAYEGLVPALCSAFPGRYRRRTLSWRGFLWAHSSFISRGVPFPICTGLCGGAAPRRQC